MNKSKDLFLEDIDNDKNQLKNFVSRLLKINEIGVIVPLIAVILIFGLINPIFFSVINLRSIIKSSSFQGIIIIGMAYSFITKQPDLSIGATAGLSAIFSGICIVRLGYPVWLSIILAMLIAAVIGLINGLLTVKLKVPPIIATLGTLFTVRGFAFLLSKGINLYPFPDYVINFIKSNVAGLPISFLIFFLLTIILDFVLRKTILGRRVYTTGANVNVAKTMGVNTDLIKISTHIQLGFLSAIAGILYMFNMGNGSPNIGLDWEFPVIAGVIIGGVSLLGGTGTVLGAFFGVILMQVLYNGLVIIGVKAEYEKLIIGLVMVIAASIDIWKRKRKT